MLKNNKRIINEIKFYAQFSTNIDEEENNVSKFIARKISEPVQTQKYVYLFLEYYPKGDLHNFCFQKQGLFEQEAKFVLRNLIEAIKLIHEQKVVLRDIKPENWVIDEKGYLRLIDFNHSAFEEEEMNEVVGTIGYMAPEVLNAKKYGYGDEVDVWWIGWLIYVTLSGNLPFQGNDKISINSAILKSPIKYYKYWSSELKDLLSKIFINSPKHRITLDGILAHAWLKDYSEEWKDVFDSVSPNSPLLSTEINDLKLKSTTDKEKDHYESLKIIPLTPNKIAPVVWQPISIDSPEKTIEEQNHEHIYKREFSFG